MSSSQQHAWLKLDVAERQRLIRAFYAGQDVSRDFLDLVRAPRGYGVYASIGPNYQYAIFGRDSIAVADDLLFAQQGLAKEVIILLAQLQGREFNMQSEEEQGKIHHEYRSTHFNGHDISKAARIVLDRIGPAWGGDDNTLLYYGSYDTTPLFVRLVRRYCLQYGEDLLAHPVEGRDGRRRPVKAIMREAVAWLASKITASPWGLYEFKRINPVGLVNQSWEDSNVAYLHDDGATANSDDGIAAVELQGYAYDALYAAAQLVAADEHEASAWRHLASMVRDSALAHLWMPTAKTFCQGLDRAEDGSARQITTVTSNPGLLLETDILTRLPHRVAWPYIEGIVRSLFSEDMLTIAGIRLRSRKHAHLVSFADYHGSLVSWPRQTHRIAQGLRRQGFYTLATILENCILETVAQAGEFYEFFFVDRQGHVKYHYRQENPDEPSFHDFGAANLPEPGQAWTISAVQNIAQARRTPSPLLPVSESVRRLEMDILRRGHVVKVAAFGGLKLKAQS